MTDRELLELLLDKVTSMESRFDKFESRFEFVETDINAIKEQTAILTEFREDTVARFDKLENKVDNLESKVNILDNKVDKLESKVDIIDTKIDNLEVVNAERHMQISKDLMNLKSDLSKVEIVTAANWGDIARIKSTQV